MLVEVAATNSFIVRRPVSTPVVQSTGRRSSSPPVPFGILVKSPTPKRFCSVVKAQWSVATTCSEPGAQAGPEIVLVHLVAEGRRHHAPRRMVPVLVEVLALVERQVLDQRLAIDPLAVARGPARSPRAPRCRTHGRCRAAAGLVGDHDGAVGGLALDLGRARKAWPSGPVMPSPSSLACIASTIAIRRRPGS